MGGPLKSVNPLDGRVTAICAITKNTKREIGFFSRQGQFKTKYLTIK
jgi:hypothetical protein